MIKSVTVKNSNNESMVLELFNPEKTGFAVTNISGLGPVKGSINTNQMANVDGAIFNSAKLDTRNIIIDLEFLEDYGIEHLRHLTYKYFPVKQAIELIFETSTRSCSITGIVESNEINMFQKNENTSISIICPDPYFRSLTETVVPFSSIEPNFEFPFSNESLTDPLIEFGTMIQDTTKNIYYYGDSRTGFTIEMHINGPVNNITVYDINTRDRMLVDTKKIKEITGKELSTGDEILLNTSRGSKSIYLFRDGLYTNILNCLLVSGNWFSLVKGDNLFGYKADTGIDNLMFTIRYTNLYEGV